MPSPSFVPATGSTTVIAHTAGAGLTSAAPVAHGVPVNIDNVPLHAPAADAASARSAPVLPQALWLLLPDASRKQLQTDYRVHGEALLDPGRMIANATEPQRQARADYFNLAARCNERPCFVRSTAPSTMPTSSALTFWCRVAVDGPWHRVPLALEDGAWHVRMSVPGSPLAALDNLQFQTLDDVAARLQNRYGLSEIEHTLDAAADSHSCLRGAVLRLVRLCNGGAPG